MALQLALSSTQLTSHRHFFMVNCKTMCFGHFPVSVGYSQQSKSEGIQSVRRTGLGSSASIPSHLFQQLLIPRSRRSRFSMLSLDDSPEVAVDIRPSSMSWKSAVSVGFENIVEAVEDAANRCKAQLTGSESVDLAIIFISSRYCEGRGGSRPATQEEITRCEKPTTSHRTVSARHLPLPAVATA